MRLWSCATNEAKTRLVNFQQDSVRFLGCDFAWRRSPPHGQPLRARGTQPQSAAVPTGADREELNHWTKHRSCAEAVRRVKRITRGWSNYYHYGHSTRVFGRQQVWLQNRVRRWLWRKDDCTHGLFSFFTDERLLGHYQRWPLPRTCAWRR